MLDEAVYTSGFDGSRFDLNCGLSAFGKPNGLHSYEWEYDLGQGRIAGASRRPYEAEVDVALMDADEAAGLSLRRTGTSRRGRLERSRSTAGCRGATSSR